MNDLQAWKEALEKHGIDADPWFKYDKTVISSIAIDVSDGDRSIWFGLKDDDHNAAEFISLVAEFVFGEWAHFKPDWLTIPNGELGWRLVDRYINSLGRTKENKRGALLNALQTKEAAS